MAGHGRPLRYTKKIGDQLCRDIAEGLSLRKACLKFKNLNVSTVLTWVLNPDLKAFSDQYALARRIQAEVMGDEIFDIADDGSNDTYEDRDGNTRTDREAINRSRLRVDTRKWYLSKVLPKVYGDKPEPPKEEKVEQPHEAINRVIVAEPKPARYNDAE